VHKISPYPNPFLNPLHPNDFETLVRFLLKHFNVTTLKDIDGQKSKKPIAVLSFDDGYYDFVEYAMPILKKYNVRVNQNIIPICVETGKPIWNVLVADFLNQSPKSLIDEISIHGFNYKLEGEDEWSKTKYGLAISRFFKNRPKRERDDLTKVFLPMMEKLDGFATTRMMSLSDVREAVKEHEIGAHSYSHESMEYESGDFFKNDVNSCISYFNEHLNMPMRIYAFPNGSYRPENIEYLKRKNVSYILLVEEKYATTFVNVLPRITISGQSQYETTFQSLGFRVKGIL
jgi:peptidoglycan/xylan/chitin deacetylase (PgdA/CDA1 family)